MMPRWRRACGPFFATAWVASMNASLRSCFPLSNRPSASLGDASRDVLQVAVTVREGSEAAVAVKAELIAAEFP